VLPSPENLAALVTGAASSFYAAKLDLSNFYHQLVLPEWLNAYFALPCLSADELQSIDQSTLTPHVVHLLSTSRLLYPCCTTLPMGFSHSVFVAQSVNEHVLYGSRVFDPANNIINLLSPTLTKPIHALFIDDCVLLAQDKHTLDSQFHSAYQRYESVSLPPNNKKCIQPTQDGVTALGTVICGRTGSISIAPDRLIKIVTATLSLFHLRMVSAKQLEQVIGYWCWIFLLRRPAFAILKHSYSFVRQTTVSGPAALWPSVRRELSVIICLTPLFVANTRCQPWKQLVATDASLIGAGVVSSQLSDPLYQAVWPLFAHSMCCLLPSPVISEPSDPLMLVATQPARRQHLLPPVVLCIQQRFHSVLLSSKWKTIISSHWKKLDHINILELESIQLACRWLLSHPSGINCRLPLLTDSSSVYFAVKKGRSSSPAMLLSLRRLSAMLLSSSVSIDLAWLPSAANPADSPSRCIPSQYSRKSRKRMNLPNG
jgi:hypothetical protein